MLANRNSINSQLTCDKFNYSAASSSTYIIDHSNCERMLQYLSAAVVCLLVITKDAHAGVMKSYEGLPRSEIINKINFHLFTKENKDTGYILKVEDEENFEKSPFNPRNPTVFFIHGFGGKVSGSSPQAIKNAYLENGHFNIILVDWAPLAKMPWYNNAIRHSAIVGKYTAALVKWLEHKRAVSIPALHIIGFSLGSHVSAFIGEELAKNQSELIGRITGLDPAGPAFDKFAIQSNGLGKEDASFVDVIHTNSRTLGLHLAVGHADFYVNAGRSQPGCGRFSIKCSHYRAWQYYAESLSNPCGFPADTCTSWLPNVGGCQRRGNVLMGVASSKHTHGIFFVETNAASPYARVNSHVDRITNAVEFRGEDNLYTMAEGAEKGLENLPDYCSGDFTKPLADNSIIEYNVISHDGNSNNLDDAHYNVD